MLSYWYTHDTVSVLVEGLRKLLSCCSCAGSVLCSPCESVRDSHPDLHAQRAGSPLGHSTARVLFYVVCVCVCGMRVPWHACLNQEVTQEWVSPLLDGFQRSLLRLSGPGWGEPLPWSDLAELTLKFDAFCFHVLGSDCLGV